MPAKDPRKVICRMIAHDFGNLKNREIGVQQIIRGTRHADLLEKLRKAHAGVLLYQRAQMGLGIVELLSEIRQGQGLIMMADGVQNL